VKEGRQPGLSIVVATQQPSAIDSDVLSQCDAILCHKITTREDIKSLNKLSQDYMGGELKTYVQNIDNVGEAVYVDDEEETVKMMKVRPRKSKHGGGEA
jgi:DNA helicase HerA-like ATPase